MSSAWNGVDVVGDHLGASKLTFWPGDWEWEAFEPDAVAVGALEVLSDDRALQDSGLGGYATGDALSQAAMLLLLE